MILSAGALLSCADATTNPSAHESGAGADDAPSTGSSAASFDAPLYAIASTVSAVDTSTTYLHMLEHLQPQQLDNAAAREYPGWTTVLAVEGKLFVADGESPQVERFAVDDDHEMISEGSIGFGNYTDAVAFFSHAYVGPTKGYFELSSGDVDLISWNPREMTVGGVVEGPEQVPFERDGLSLYASYDRGVAVRDGEVFQPLYWVDEDWYRFSQVSQIAVFDAETDAVLDVVDAPCPELDVATADEQGNLYFSNWVYSAAAPLFDAAAPRNCMVRIAAGTRTIDEAATLHFSELTDGREAAAFRYLADGKGLLTVFHDERLEDGVAPGEAVFSTNWRFWLVDLEARSAEPLEGLDYVAPGYYAFRVDGRMLLLVPTEDLAVTTVYEISDDGSVTRLFDVDGWAYQLMRVR